MTFVNNHGSEITSEDLEEWAAEAADGNFDNWESFKEPSFEDYLGTDVSDASTVTFLCPLTLKLKLGVEAKRLQCTNSDLLRMLVTEGLKNMSTSQD